MRHPSLRGTVLASGVVVVMLLITAGIGFCAADGDHDGHDHAVRHGLCATFVAVTAPGLVLGGLAVTGAAVANPRWVVVAAPISVLVPPPKSFSRS
jgi:hypothetical protein